MTEEKSAEDDFAQQQMALLGIKDCDPAREIALDAARRGHPAWRFAQSLGLSAETVYLLGGPVW